MKAVASEPDVRTSVVRAGLAPTTAVVLVGCVYVFFLLFAQFGFLQGIRALGLPAETIQASLGAMALAGMGASLLAPALVARFGTMRVVAAGLDLCVLAAGAAAILFARAQAGVLLLGSIALLTGAGLGLATVALASDLRRLAGPQAIGLRAGLGTGLAYLICNLPPVFAGEPELKAWLSGGAAAAGVILAWRARTLPSWEETSSGAARNLDRRRWLEAMALAGAATAFLALVWFDSLAFAVVQNTPAWRERFWSGEPTLWRNGLVHAGAAVAAGAALDRGRWRQLLFAASGLLVAGSWLFPIRGAGDLAAAPLYAAGVSIYSTTLAAFAGLLPAVPGRLAPAWRAAWIYTGAGWFGSAAGVGLAEQLDTLPAWAAPLALVGLTAALALHAAAAWPAGGKGRSQ